MPFPDKPYIATHTATYASGFTRDLVPYGEPCAYKLGDETTAHPQYCGDTNTYLDGGAARCAVDLTPLCKHGYASCLRCDDFPKDPPKVVKLAQTRKAQGANDQQGPKT